MTTMLRSPLMRCTATLILAVSVLAPLAGTRHAAAQRTARDDAFVFHGITGQRHTFALQGGRYVLNVYASYNGLPPNTYSTCAFTAHLNGIEHPLGGLSTLGSLQVGAVFPYRYIPTLNLPAGHYTLDVSPLTDCNWSVSIGGGGSDHPVISFGETGIYHMLDGHNEKTSIVETTARSYSFGFTYNAWGAGFTAPSARLTVLQHGRALHTYKLTPATGDYGQTAFSTALAFRPGRDRPGAYIARYAITLGQRTVTRSVDYTLQALAPGHWAIQSAATSNDLSAIACPGASTCVIPGKNATVLTTTDGHAWTRRSTPLDGTSFINLYGTACPTLRTCYVVGDQYSILGSTDGGQTWTKQSGDETYTSLGQDFINLACPTERHCYVVGRGGITGVTTDGGAHWTLQAGFGSGKDLTDVACPTETTCLAVGLAGTILRTTNGGASWQRRTVASVGSNYLFSIACPTARICYATGQQGTILATTDGGATWTSQNNPLAGSHLWVDSVACSTALTCHAVGQAGTLLLTTDGGRSWRDQPSPTTKQLNVVTCPSAGTCYAVGSSGTIIKGA